MDVIRQNYPSWRSARSRSPHLVLLTEWTSPLPRAQFNGPDDIVEDRGARCGCRFGFFGAFYVVPGF